MVNSAMTQTGETRAHGGDLDRAIARHGGSRADWLDLSTGINARPWPVAAAVREMPDAIWQALPDQSQQARLLDAARRAYGVHPANAIVAAPGTQSLIQLLPRLAEGQVMTVRHPSYNEHRGVFADAGWTIVSGPSERASKSDAAVIVNPNNPDGLVLASGDLLDRARQVGTLIVDEAFADMTPAISLCGHALPENVVVLRSFGKFFGLAGLRLGFAIGAPAVIDRFSSMLGPWAVSGPAQYLGARALNDAGWIMSMKQTLHGDCAAMRKILNGNGLTDLMGTDLFQTARTARAQAIHESLASAHVWTRVFDTWPDHIRFGIPGTDAGFDRLNAALQKVSR